MHAAWSDPLRCFSLHAAYISQRPGIAQDLLCIFGPPARQHAAARLLQCGLYCMQVEVCREQVEWANREKRTFLRQRIEARLAGLYLGAKDYTAALSIISRLLTEVILHAPLCHGRLTDGISRSYVQGPVVLIWSILQTASE